MNGKKENRAKFIEPEKKKGESQLGLTRLGKKVVCMYTWNIDFEYVGIRRFKPVHEGR